MSYTSNQYKYLLIKRLQRSISMENAHDRAYTQSFFWKLFDESVTVTEEAYNNFCRLMDDDLALCAENGWYDCKDVPTKVINEQGLLLTEVFAEIGVDCKIDGTGTGTAKFKKSNGEEMVYAVAYKNLFFINARAGTEYQYAKASAPAYNMQGMDVPQELGNPKIAGPGSYWSYNADTNTVTISGEGAYAGATNETQLGSGTYNTVVIGVDVSRLLNSCIVSGVTALVLLQSTDGSIVIDPKFNSSSKLDVYTDCTAAIAALKAVEKPENITLHSLSEWNG